MKICLLAETYIELCLCSTRNVRVTVGSFPAHLRSTGTHGLKDTTRDLSYLPSTISETMYVLLKGNEALVWEY
ncbi:hypothetical protein DPMN_061647 [Dreissena polymorpha]|uniref:Uncharacterized protein n=1 Tax=Dreissena polymorpha TaxID=45954 RepID=A0A9D4C883_DREPO|nr:hypothetical protein DPMN_061647 [Dreissena polymorpha]